MTFDSTNNKVILAYKDENDSSKGKARVGTISGSSIRFRDLLLHLILIVFLILPYVMTLLIIEWLFSTLKVVPGYAVVGTVSGTSISFGSRVEFGSNIAMHTRLVVVLIPIMVE